ncbi:unnamed protein product, partial [Mesorhabditis spiculigera]
MGASLCKPKKKKQVGSSWVGNESENPFDLGLNKKERVCLRETYMRLHDAKELIGIIFADIVFDIEPDLKKVFGVERAPKATMSKMPKFGGHIARFSEFLEQVTSMLGFTDNVAGAWQLVRKTGRSHVRQSFLEQNQNQMGKNYFQIVIDSFIIEFIPYLTGDKEEPMPESDKKKVRFAQNYSPTMIYDVWKRFFNILLSQLVDSFELERTKQRNAQSQKALAPHQHVEQSERKKRKIQEKASEIENTAGENEPKEPEQMFEDPF